MVFASSSPMDPHCSPVWVNHAVPGGNYHGAISLLEIVNHGLIDIIGIILVPLRNLTVLPVGITNDLVCLPDVCLVQSVLHKRVVSQIAQYLGESPANSNQANCPVKSNSGTPGRPVVVLLNVAKPMQLHPFASSGSARIISAQ